MRWVLLSLGVVVVCVGGVVLWGIHLPVAHVAARTAIYDAPPDSVWSAISDVAAFPLWRTDVRAVEALPDRDGHRVWQEHGTHRDITYEAVETAAPHRLVARIASAGLPFGGSWTYEIAAAGSGARLTITEHGEVYNPIFRFVSRFVLGHTATMDDYLTALGGRFGQTTTPVDAPVGAM